MAVLVDGAKRGRPGTVVLDYRDGRGLRRWRQFPDTPEGRKAAQIALGDALRKSARGEASPDPRVPLRTVAETWLKVAAPSLSETTRKNYRHVLDRHILEAWGAVPVTRIKRSEIRAWLAEELERYARATVNQSLVVMRLVLRYAIEDGLLTGNPASGVARGMRLLWSPERIRAMTEEQLARFLERADAHMRLLAFTGLRLGESFGLQGQDVDPERKVLHVERQRYPNGTVARLKTPAARREVDLGEALTLALADLPPVRFRSAEFLFPESRDQFYRRFAGALEAASLSGFTPHCLRHTFATIHLTAGADLEWLRRQLGHTSPTMTAAVYGKAARPKPRGAPEAFERAVSALAPVGQRVIAFP